MSFARVILIVIDACGVGELPDAAKYGDSGAATFPHVAEAVGGLQMPNCARLGLGNIVPIDGVPPAASPLACYGKMAERSPGKDSTTGHWEIAGVPVGDPFPLFPNGFPLPLVREFERRTGVETIGNVAASGTEIITRLGAEHLKTGKLILYTSADSVFQLAAHDSIYPQNKLYEICRIARELLSGEYAVARVIARPFNGKTGAFARTAGRKDFSLPPSSDTFMDLMLKQGHKTMAVGKILDLFAGRGFTSHVKAANNAAVMKTVIEEVKSDSKHQLLFANCVDFDMLWGHRNDEIGFAHGLEEFDRYLGELLCCLHENDLLIVTADHGCDPTLKDSTDHTREYVPLLAYGRGMSQGIDLGVRQAFSDIACTVAEVFDLTYSFPGSSFLGAIKKQE